MTPKLKNSNDAKWSLLLLALLLTFFSISCLLSGLMTWVYFSGNDSPFNELDDAFETFTGEAPDMLWVGESYLNENWIITLAPHFSEMNDKLEFHFLLQNRLDIAQDFHYLPDGIHVYDDQDNSYPLYLGYCENGMAYEEQIIQVGAGERIKLSSHNEWCYEQDGIPPFIGVIPHDAQFLYIWMEDFGDLENIIFIFDLYESFENNGNVRWREP